MGSCACNRVVDAGLPLLEGIWCKVRRLCCFGLLLVVAGLYRGCFFIFCFSLPLFVAAIIPPAVVAALFLPIALLLPMVMILPIVPILPIGGVTLLPIVPAAAHDLKDVLHWLGSPTARGQIGFLR